MRKSALQSRLALAALWALEDQHSVDGRSRQDNAYADFMGEEFAGLLSKLLTARLRLSLAAVLIYCFHALMNFGTTVALFCVTELYNNYRGYVVSNEQLVIAAEYRRLSNGRYIGVVTQSLAGRISFDSYELDCPEERESKSEALRDAESIISRSGSGL